MQVPLRVNGKARQVDAAPAASLLPVLRDALDLTGAKYGCGEGQCGACTVLLADQAVRSCQAKASSLQGRNAILDAIGFRIYSLPMIPRGLPGATSQL